MSVAPTSRALCQKFTLDIIVRALLSTNFCSPDHIVVIHGSQEFHDLLTTQSTSNGWSKVATTNVASARGHFRKVVIICLPRNESELRQSSRQRYNVPGHRRMLHCGRMKVRLRARSYERPATAHILDGRNGRKFLVEGR